MEEEIELFEGLSTMFTGMAAIIGVVALRSQNLITETEYQQRKREILNEI